MNPKVLALASAVAATFSVAAPARAAEPPCQSPPATVAGNVIDAGVFATGPYEVVTTLRTSSGDAFVNRRTPGTTNAPTRVNVDGDTAAELEVNISPDSTGRLVLRIDRLDASTARLPVKVTVQMRRATSESTPGEPAEALLEYGYDTRTAPSGLGNAPRTFSTTLDAVLLERLPSPGPLEPNPPGARSHVIASVSTTGSVPDMTLIGDLKATAGPSVGERKHATVQLTPAPSHISVDLRSECREDADRTTVTLAGASGPRMELDAFDSQLAGGVRLARHADLDIATLAGAVTIRTTSDRDSEKEATVVDPRNVLNSASVRVQEDVPGRPGVICRTARATLTTIPAAGFTLETLPRGAQDEPATCTDPESAQVKLTVPFGARIGRIVGATATRTALPAGEPSLFVSGDLSEGEQGGYARIGEDVTQFAAADIGSVLVDTNDPDNPGHAKVVADIGPQAFAARVDKPGQLVTARALDLPGRVALLIGPAGRTLRYQAAGVLPTLKVTATAPGGLFQRSSAKPEPTHAVITANALPPCLALDLVEGLSLDTKIGVPGEPTACPTAEEIRSIDALVTHKALTGALRQPTADNAVGTQGISLEDTRTGAERFVLHAALRDLHSVDFDSNELPVGGPDGTTATRRIAANLRFGSSADRPVFMKLDRDEFRDGQVKLVYTDLRLQRQPARVNATIETDDSRAPGVVCDRFDYGTSTACDTGVRVTWDASSAIPKGLELPALRLDTNAGFDRERPVDSNGTPLNLTSYRTGKPNLRLDVPIVPAKLTFCGATDGRCAKLRNENTAATFDDASLLLEASLPMAVELFDCKEAGDDNVCEVTDESAEDRQIQVRADVEAVTFVEMALERPEISDSDTGSQVGEDIGRLYMNTSHDPDGDGTDFVHEHIIGEGDQDVFIQQRSPDRCQAHAIKRTEINLDDETAVRRLLPFFIGNLSTCTPKSIAVVEDREEGTMTCGNAFQIDVAMGIPGGHLDEELCNTPRRG